jgi:hypothetical protein
MNDSSTAFGTLSDEDLASVAGGLSTTTTIALAAVAITNPGPALAVAALVSATYLTGVVAGATGH